MVIVGRRRSSGQCQSTPVWARYWLSTQVIQPRTCPGETTHGGDKSDNEDNDDIDKYYALHSRSSSKVYSRDSTIEYIGYK